MESVSAGVHPWSRATSVVAVLTWLTAARSHPATVPTAPPCSPWHRGGRVPRGVQLHQEILWGQQGRGSRARRGDPGEGWERGRRSPQLQDIIRGRGPEPCHWRWQWCQSGLATVWGWLTNARCPRCPVEDTAFWPGQAGGRPGHLPWDRPCHQRQGNHGCQEHPARDRRGVSVETQGGLEGLGGAG